MINRVHLIGNTGKDPEIRTTGSGKKVASFSLATSESYKDHSGQKVTETQWHNIKAWGNLAEVAEKYVRKGQLLYIEGKVTYSSYDDKDGNKKYVTEIIASNFQMLGGKKTDDVATRPEPQSEAPTTGQPNTSDGSDDLPF
mgnify:CR=1 FL=1